MTENKTSNKQVISRWHVAYAIVIAFLILQIVFFYFFTRYFS